MNLMKKEFLEHSSEKVRENKCIDCGKIFTKPSSFYNHRKMSHGYKPTKENERGRPIKSESKPFVRVLEEIFISPRKAMQDKVFPELAKILLKIVRKEKEFYDKVFDCMEKFEKDFEEFVKRSEIFKENCICSDYLKIKSEENGNELKRFFRILLENWRLTLKLTDGFCKELAIIIGYFLENNKKNKEELVEGIKENLKLPIILIQNMNSVGDENFIEKFIDILINWKKNYKL